MKTLTGNSHSAEDPLFLGEPAEPKNQKTMVHAKNTPKSDIPKNHPPKISVSKLFHTFMRLSNSPNFRILPVDG